MSVYAIIPVYFYAFLVVALICKFIFLAQKSEMAANLIFTRNENVVHFSDSNFLRVFFPGMETIFSTDIQSFLDFWPDLDISRAY